MDSLDEGHKGWNRNVIGIAGAVDQAGVARSVTSAQNGVGADLRIGVKREGLAPIQSRETGDHE
jgi:hypothetical protein